MTLYRLGIQQGEEHQSFETELAGEQVRFTLRQNDADNSFYVHTKDGDENITRAGMRLVTNYVIWLSWGPGKPQGQLLAFDPTGTHPVANVGNLGTDVELLWDDGL